MKTVKFDSEGSRIKANFRFEGLVTGVYAFNLFEANSNETVISGIIGNNLNDDDDVYPLPMPPMANKDRIVHIQASVDAIDTDTDYTVFIEIIQNEKIIGAESRSGHIKVGHSTANHMLMVKLTM